MLNTYKLLIYYLLIARFHFWNSQILFAYVQDVAVTKAVTEFVWLGRLISYKLLFQSVRLQRIRTHE